MLVGAGAQPMPIHIHQEEPGGLLVATVSGRIHYSEFLPVWQKSAEAIERVGKIRILILLDNFHGWETSEAWGDTSFQQRYDTFIERIAIVGDSQWKDLVLAFAGKPFRTLPIQYFLPTQLAEARAWLGKIE
jgi:SpoIIAA-like